MRTEAFTNITACSDSISKRIIMYFKVENYNFAVRKDLLETIRKLSMALAEFFKNDVVVSTMDMAGEQLSAKFVNRKII